MKPIPWYYIYSPKYEIFHHMLSSSIGPTTDFNVCPVFLPQEAFSNTYSIPGEHFFTGNTLKLDLMIKALEQHPGEHVIVSDADVIADDSSNFRLYLESYMNNDITISPDVGTTIGYSNVEVLRHLEDLLSNTTQWAQYSFNFSGNNNVSLVGKESPIFKLGWRPKYNLNAGLEHILSSSP